MAIPDDPKAWALAQAERLRSDPKGWARDQGERAKKMVNIAPFSDEHLKEELIVLRAGVARAKQLSSDERIALHDAIVDLRERIAPGGAIVSGAKIGLAASILPVVGMITGPILGGAYGALRSKQLASVRTEIDEMLRTVVRSGQR